MYSTDFIFEIFVDKIRMKEHINEINLTTAHFRL